MLIVVYFDAPEKMGYPFNDAKTYESYKAFAAISASSQVDLYFARGKESYQGNMLFKNGFFFQGDKLVFYATSYKADIVLNKGHSIAFGKHDKVLNASFLTQVCYDKQKTFHYFGNYMVATFPINLPNNFLFWAYE